MLDIQTVFILFFIISAICTGALAVILHQNRGRFAGVSFWLAAMALQTGGAALIVLRGRIGDAPSVVLSYTMLLTAAVVILMGLERFAEKKGRHIHNFVLLAVFVILSIYFSSVHPNLTARDIVLSAMVMIFTFQCSWLLLARVDPGIRRITRITGVLFGCYAALSFIGAILYAMFPTHSPDFLQAGLADFLTVTLYLVLTICLTISLVLMVNRRLLADVKAQEEKFTIAFHSSPYAITLSRIPDGKIIEVNDGFVNISGYQHEEAVGKTTAELNLWANDEDRRALVKMLEERGEVHGLEYPFRRKSGEVLTGLLSASRVVIDNEQCILASISDISDRKRMEQMLLEMATHDTLTGLPNRNLLNDRFGVALANAERHYSKVVVMLLDLDFFKNVNDTLGHEMGDRLLVAAAGRLTGSLRKSDTIARMGGDEFALLLWEINGKGDAAKVAEKIVGLFRQPFLLDGHSLRITISVGVALCPENGKTLEDLFKSADKSLYSAKQSGRDQYIFS